jgi:hypothetical protein
MVQSDCNPGVFFIFEVAPVVTALECKVLNPNILECRIRLNWLYSAATIPLLKCGRDGRVNFNLTGWIDSGIRSVPPKIL